MTDLRDLFDVAEDGQLSLAVSGEQMPLDGLARPPARAVEPVRQPMSEAPPETLELLADHPLAAAESRAAAAGEIARRIGASRTRPEIDG